METNYAKSAYRTFLFWGVCSSLGVTVSTLVDATLVGNFIGSTGIGCGEHCYTGISALFTYGNHPRRRCRRLNWGKNLVKQI